MGFKKVWEGGRREYECDKEEEEKVDVGERFKVVYDEEGNKVLVDRSLRLVK